MPAAGDVFHRHGAGIPSARIPVNAPQGNPPSLFRRVGEMAAFGTVLWFIIALALEAGYWGGFGISLAEIPFSIQQLLDSVLVWLPKLPVVLLLYVFYEVAAIKAWGLKIGDDVFPPFKYSKELAHKANWWCLFFVALSLIQIALTGELFFVLTYSLIYFVWYYAGRIILNHTIFARFKSVKILMSLSVVPFLAMLYFLGFWFSIHDSTNSDKIAAVQYKKSSNIESENLAILRNTGDFIIAYNPDLQHLRIIPQGVVRELVFHSKPNWNITVFE